MFVVPHSDGVDLDDDLKRALEDAHRVLANLLDRHLQALFSSDGFPERLSHYTDFAGLKGILETNSLWANHCGTLNDGTEKEYGTRVVSDYLSVRLKGTKAARQLAEGMASWKSRDFATCFCESTELLSMWKGYAGYAGCYCLEFDSVELLGCSFPPFPARLPFKISYGSTLPDTVIPILETIRQFAQKGHLEASVSASWANMMALKIKHPAFAQENERRIVIRDPPVQRLCF